MLVKTLTSTFLMSLKRALTVYLQTIITMVTWITSGNLKTPITLAIALGRGILNGNSLGFHTPTEMLTWGESDSARRSSYELWSKSI